jgi:hypothetical protein
MRQKHGMMSGLRKQNEGGVGMRASNVCGECFIMHGFRLAGFRPLRQGDAPTGLAGRENFLPSAHALG